MTPDRFEAGLIDRLQLQHPGVDVRWVADEIGQARNPSAVLTDRVKKAERQGHHVPGTRPKTPHQLRNWGFSVDGRLLDNGHHDRALTAFVRELVELRRNSREAPADLAGRIREAGHELAFGVVLVAWDALTNFRSWPNAFCSTSAAETVKRAGYAHVRWCETCSNLVPDGVTCTHAEPAEMQGSF